MLIYSARDGAQWAGVTRVTVTLVLRSNALCTRQSSRLHYLLRSYTSLRFGRLISGEGIETPVLNPDGGAPSPNESYVVIGFPDIETGSIFDLRTSSSSSSS